ncbi:adenylosuccinate synthetase isozyme [Acrasis kona]|uniref:Adenylosuccinate synthetase isozyme n=1 Tax=Acrasis kona TaxID=1008807 RepID=A0AAW2ZK47_9EUKA
MYKTLVHPIIANSLKMSVFLATKVRPPRTIRAEEFTSQITLSELLSKTQPGDLLLSGSNIDSYSRGLRSIFGGKFSHSGVVWHDGAEPWLISSNLFDYSIRPKEYPSHLMKDYFTGETEVGPGLIKMKTFVEASRKVQGDWFVYRKLVGGNKQEIANDLFTYVKNIDKKRFPTEEEEIAQMFVFLLGLQNRIKKPGQMGATCNEVVIEALRTAKILKSEYAQKAWTLPVKVLEKGNWMEEQMMQDFYYEDEVWVKLDDEK